MRRTVLTRPLAPSNNNGTGLLKNCSSLPFFNAGNEHGRRPRAVNNGDLFFSSQRLAHMRQMFQRKFLLLIGLVLMARASAVWADDEPQTPEKAALAKAHYAKGRALADKKRYRKAIDEFEVGYAISRRPLFLFNIGECARQLGDHALARRMYERYLEQEPKGVVAKQAEVRLKELPTAVVKKKSTKELPAPVVKKKSTSVPKTNAPSDRSTKAKAKAQPGVAGHPPIVPPGATRLATVPVRRDGKSRSRPLWKRWSFWTAVGVGASVLAGTAVIYMARSDDCVGGCIDLRN